MRFFQLSEDFRDDGEPVFAVWREGDCFHFPRWDEEGARRLQTLLNFLISEYNQASDD